MRLSALFLLAAFPVQAATLAAHHAVYALSLDTTKDGAMSDGRGTMTYDVVDTCTGWTTSQHLVIDLTSKDGKDSHMVSDYATLESRDGTHLNFHTRQVTDAAVTEQLDGTAVLDRSGGGGHADYTSPEVKTMTLPAGTLLPMAHTGALLDAAAAGKKFLAVPLFDGTGSDGAQDTFVTLVSWHPPAAQKTWAALAKMAYGQVHIAFFDRDQKAQTPDYEIAMRYFANGVADGMTMDFGDFVMDGHLQTLEMRPARC